MRWLVPLVVVLVVGGGLYLLFGADAGLGPRREVVREEESAADVPPHLRGLPPRLLERRERERREREAAGDASIPAMEASNGRTSVVLRGRVVADESGEGIESAILRGLRQREPCPRVVTIAEEYEQRSETGPGWADFMSVQEDGSFILSWFASRDDPLPPFDLYVTAPGRVPAMLCGPAIDEEVEVRLKKGLVLEGRVRTEDGRPIEGVSVSARPGPETPALPGHAAAPVTTSEDGTYRFDAFLPGDVYVDADHPSHMPGTWGPIDPATQSTLDLTLLPALLATFDVRTDDGREAKNVTLTWETTRGAREPRALILPRLVAEDDVDLPSRETNALHGPVRLPAAEGPLRLVVRADGYADWTTEFRPEGASRERTFSVDLRGDRSTGSARIALEDPDGRPLDVAGLDVRPALTALDPGAVPAAFVVVPKEDLVITALPAGRYRVGLVSPAFAPLETEIEVIPGVESTATLRARPPAKLRVRFFAPEPTLVRFRVLRDGREVVALPEGVTNEDGVLAAGEEGLLLSGLAGGLHQVDVVSDDVSAPVTSVRLVEGETEEVEIAVTPR